MDVLRHARLTCVLHGQRNLSGIEIEARNAQLATRIGGLQCLRLDCSKAGEVKVRPVQEVEIAPSASGKIGSDHGGLNGQCAAAAEGICKRTVGPPYGEQNQRGGQRLFKGRFSHGRAVAAAVQPLSRRIQAEGDDIAQNGDLDAVERAGLGQRRASEPFAHAGADGLFDDALAGGEGVKPALDALAIEVYFRVRGQIILPREGPCALEQGVKVLGAKAGQLDHDPVGRAQQQIAARDVGLAAGHADAAVLCRGQGIAQLCQLALGHGLDSGRGGDLQSVLHGSSPRNVEIL